MRKLDITRDALEFVKGLAAKPYRQVLQKVLALLSEPQPNDSVKLKGYEFYRVDIGEYRIVYRFDEETVTIAVIGKRNDDEAYRDLKRKE